MIHVQKYLRPKKTTSIKTRSKIQREKKYGQKGEDHILRAFSIAIQTTVPHENDP
jgi:hypothetical protein